MSFAPQLVDMLREELAETGLLALLADADTTDLMVNEDGSVWLQQLHRGLSRVPDLSVRADDLESLLGTVASLHGTVISPHQPVLEATLPLHGARLEALLPPLVTAPVLALRRPPTRLLTLDDLVENDTLPRGLADELRQAVLDAETCVVAGGVGSGKTTLVNALLAELLAAAPEERIVLLEEGARELLADAPNVIRLLTSETAGYDMTALLRTALRLNPTRILIGEVRGPEALDFLRAANTGHPGSLLTVHANGAAETLDRLDALAQEAGVPSQARRVAETVDRVIFIARVGTKRRVVEVLAVDGLDTEGAPRITRLFHHTDHPTGDPP